MKTKTIQKTRIQRLIERYESNRQYILRAAKISEDQYDGVFHEAGCLFLEEIYPREEQFEALYIRHSRSPQFWAWWMVEWKKWECDFVTYLIDNPNKASQAEWFNQMTQMAFDGNTEMSFYNNYLKPLKNVL